ncbi:MAG: heterodisulfide reductase-related iron-sulfur binding cluster [Bacteroidales bacterium]|nr:heterodisulfide reductase-related iron-sulfur binding cluster [Bacteroidales bacterium]
MKQYWKDYQKDIADDNYFYVRSCIRQNFFPGAENLFIDILKNKLGKTVFEDAEHTTCTGIGYHTDVVPLETTMTVIARQFALMKEKGYRNMIASCVTSFGLYSEVLDMWKHQPELREKIAGYLMEATGRTFVEPENMVHASDILYKYRNEIASIAKYKLINKTTGEPLKVVDHIGCHYAKTFPERGVGGSEFPQVLTGLITAWGGQTVDYPERRHCCGFGFRNYLVQPNRGYSISQSKIKLESMKPYEPDLIVANCPGCSMFLDRWQYTLEETEGTVYGACGNKIPVFTHEELAGLVLGYDPWEIGLQTHQVPVEGLLDKIGVEYNPGLKYTDRQGNLIGEPEMINQHVC